MPSPEKFRESLLIFLKDQNIIQQINFGYEDLKSNSPKKEIAEYLRRAMQIMDESLDKETNYQILDYNACCKKGSRDKSAKAFAKTNQNLSLEEKIALISTIPNMGKPVLIDNKIINTGIYWYLNGKYKCACPNFNHLKEIPNVSLTHCYCCAGHFRHHYQNMLNLRLRTKEIISSPLASNGEKPCLFSFEIEEI